jgi:hypothetical protein
MNSLITKSRTLSLATCTNIRTIQLLQSCCHSTSRFIIHPRPSPATTNISRHLSTGTSTNPSPTEHEPSVLDTSTNKTIQNLALQSVKEQGLKILKSTTIQIQSKTQRRLLLSQEDSGPTPDQLREAHRLKLLVEDAIEEYTSRKGDLFCSGPGGEPIAIIDVEVTQDLRQARVFWSLPFSLLLIDVDRISSGSGGGRGMHRDGQEMRMRAAKRMQMILEEKGGVLQGLVHRKLRRYFRPPKIRFVMAEGEMLRAVLKEIL